MSLHNKWREAIYKLNCDNPGGFTSKQIANIVGGGHPSDAMTRARCAGFRFVVVGRLSGVRGPNDGRKCKLYKLAEALEAEAKTRS